MRIIAIHSSKFSYEPKSPAYKDAEEVAKELKEFGQCLVVFGSVEKEDEKNVSGVIDGAVAEISKDLEEIKEKKVVIYPWVHLADSPSSPKRALEVLQGVTEALGEKGYDAVRAPFGWYKAFDISCLGHPLAEKSRRITASAKDDVSQALKAEDTLTSNWFILDLEGRLNPIAIKDKKIEGFDFSGNKKLEKLALYEMAKSRIVDQEPPHVKLMRKLELVDYEPGSDPGHFRYPPKGRMVKALLEDWTTKNVLDYGAMEIEAPIMFDFEHPTLNKYLNRFPARQYTIETPNRRLFLRFAACFGQFLMLHDAPLSYRHFPIRMYELTKYSFRYEKRGELTGLRRLRAFTMPDCHAFTRDVNQARAEMLKRVELSKRVQEGVGLTLKDDFEFAIRVVKDFWEDNKEFVIDLVKKFGKPALIEMWDKRFFYFILKYEFNFIDALDKASTLTTDQIDVENGERYELEYVDEKGEKNYPIILHLSPSGAIERQIYALLEKAYMTQESGGVASLPLWLSPTQVRIVPVSEEHLEYAKTLAQKLGPKIRVDIDDRNETIGKRVRSAELEWVPYIVVVGNKEIQSGKLPVRMRTEQESPEMTTEELKSYIVEKTEGKPFRPLPVPPLLSERIEFIPWGAD